jgi:hypothetical protein
MITTIVITRYFLLIYGSFMAVRLASPPVVFYKQNKRNCKDRAQEDPEYGSEKICKPENFKKEKDKMMNRNN